MSASLSPRPSGAPGAPTRQQLDELDALLQRMLALPVNQLGEPEADADAEMPPPREPRAAPGVSAPRPPRPAQPPVSYSIPPTEEHPAPPPGLAPRVVPAGDAEDDGEDYGELRDDDDGAGPRRLADPTPPAAAPRGGEEPEGWVPFRSSWEPSPLTWQPLKENWPEVQAALRQRARAETAEPPAGPPPGVEVNWAAPTLPPDEPDDPPAAPEPPARVELPPLAEPKPAPAPTPAPAAAEAPRSWLGLPLVGFNAVFDLGLWPLGPLGRWLRGRGGRVFLGALGLLGLLAAAGLAVADWIGWTW